MGDLPTVAETSARAGLSGRIGTSGIVFSTVAFLAPLAAMAGTVTLVIGYGNGLGTPLAYLAMGVLLGLFSIGYMQLVRHIPRPGAFYAYISAALGRRMGLACSGLSLCLYLMSMVSIWAFASVQVESLLKNAFGFDALPWWVYSLAFLAIIGVLCYRGIDLSVRLVGAVVIVELAIIFIFNIATLVRGGPDGYLPESFSMSSFTSGSLPIALLFCVCTVVGFEATAIFREEARDPEKTIPRATYLIVGGGAIFYAFSSWCLIVAVGRGVTQASADNPAGVFTDALASIFGNTIRDWVQLLVVTSSAASGLTITNVASRYLYSLGVDRMLPRGLGQAHRRHGSPHLAVYAATGVAVIGTMALVAGGFGPVEIYSQSSGVDVLVFELLLFLVSLAVVVHFRRDRVPGVSVWSTVVAPVVAMIMFGLLIVFTSMNVDLLTGAPSALTPIFGGSFAVAAVIGFGYASWLAKRDRTRFERIGRAVE
ncbi:APC family permease [Mycolicibacterium sp. CBMA 360]|uniref:amino acid permease n=1 Tax=Mycolicibacterium sp. CBMA 360 TaxID=2606614 RepID=UPI001390CB0C